MGSTKKRKSTRSSISTAKATSSTISHIPKIQLKRVDDDDNTWSVHGASSLSTSQSRSTKRPKRAVQSMSGRVTKNAEESTRKTTRPLSPVNMKREVKALALDSFSKISQQHFQQKRNAKSTPTQRVETPKSVSRKKDVDSVKRTPIKRKGIQSANVTPVSSKGWKATPRVIDTPTKLGRTSNNDAEKERMTPTPKTPNRTSKRAGSKLDYTSYYEKYSSEDDESENQDYKYTTNSSDSEESDDSSHREATTDSDFGDEYQEEPANTSKNSPQKKLVSEGGNSRTITAKLDLSGNGKNNTFDVSILMRNGKPKNEPAKDDTTNVDPGKMNL